MSIFHYEQIPLPEDCVFKISPSSISKFFDNATIWYREQVKGEVLFTNSTSTVLGTIIHYIAEQYAINPELDPVQLKETIDQDLLLVSEPDVDKNLIRDLYPMMAEALINEYVSTNPPTEVEYQTLAHVKDGVYVGGTVDNRTGTTITDYKNVSTKPNTTSIPFGYKIQMLAYAYADRERGIETDRIRLVYTVRPTKTLPVRVFVVNHMIQESDWILVEQTLNLIAESVLAVRNDPSITHLVFKSMNLKQQ